LREILEAYSKGVIHGLQDGVMVMKAMHAEVVAKSEHRMFVNLSRYFLRGYCDSKFALSGLGKSSRVDETV
jgi:hypothetical protein